MAHEGALLPGADSGEPFYENRFTCIPDSVPYRPPRKTRKAQMLGSQTAVVVGPRARRSTPTGAASRCSSTGTARASGTKTARAGSA